MSYAEEMVKDFGNPFLVQVTYNRLLLAMYCCTFLAFQGVFLGIIEYEWTLNHGESQ
jgi:hypothetical protein